MTLIREGYRARLVDEKIGRYLEAFGAVSIEGPKWCGKTWTGENHACSEIRIDGMTGPLKNKDIVSNDLSKALEGCVPHLIDEWQEVPAIWDCVRSSVDEDGSKGRFILTGSSVPRRDEYSHSGAGRIAKVPMRTMSLFETGDSSGEISLKELFNRCDLNIDCGERSLSDLIGLTIRGGWPGNIGTPRRDSGLVASEYIRYIVEDACRMDGVRRQQEKMLMLLKSLSRNESTMVSDKKIMDDMKRFDDENISAVTYSDYVDCLYRVHLLADTPCFRPNVRSDMRIGKKPKRHLTDVSLAVSALGLTEEMLMNDLNTFGFMFESLCEHDLDIYADRLGGKLFHYRDGRDREIDAVIELGDKRWGAFEIKVGTGQIESAADNLIKISRIMEAEGTAPSVLCVICGMTRYAYRRPDGVYVVPITALAP